MLNKKIKLGIIFFIVVAITVFLVWFIPKFWVIHNHVSKIEVAEKTKDGYIKTTYYNGNTIQVEEVYLKGDKYLADYTISTIDEEQNQITRWTDGNREYGINRKEKTAVHYDEVTAPYGIEYQKVEDVQNIWEEIGIALTSVISWDMSKETLCNVIKVGNTMYWVDKDTGLIVQKITEGTKNKANLYEYEYSNTIKDKDVEMIDLSNYQISKGTIIR